MKPSARTFWAVLALIALLLRTGVLYFGAQGLKEDPDAYRAYAVSMAKSGIFGLPDGTGTIRPSAYRPPLYPWLLHWGGATLENDARAILAIGSLHLLIGLATCLLTAMVAMRLAGGLMPCSNEASSRLFAGCATLLVACDPILLNQSRLVMTETLATYLALLGWWSWLRMLEPLPNADGGREGRPSHAGTGWAWVAGVFAGLAVLCRPTAWPAVLGMLAGLVFIGFAEKSPAQRAAHRRQLVGLTMGLLLLAAPWVIRNQLQLGSPIVMTTHGGFTLYLANNPSLYDHFGSGNYARQWDPEPFHHRWKEQRDAFQKDGPVSELQMDQYAEQLAKETIAARPLVFFQSCLARLGWLWAWWPQQVAAGYASTIAIGCFYAVESLLALWGLGSLVGWRCTTLSHRSERTGWWFWLPGLATMFTLSAIHAIYWSNMRMRAPAIPAVALLASLGAMQIVHRFVRMRPRRCEVSR